MAIGPDRVQVQQEETTSGGGDPADVGPYGGPVPIEPQQDAIESAGHYFQDAVDRDEEVYVCRDAGELCFRDTNNTTPVTLSSLASATIDFNRLILTTTGGLVYNLACQPVLETP